MRVIPSGCSAIEDEAEDLLRQVHPTQFKNDGKPDSSAFSPSPRDKMRMSTRREQIGAQQACGDWLSAGKLSGGTWGVRPADLPDDVIAYDDSALAGMPAGHASVDFVGTSTSRQKKVGRLLRDASWRRGNLYAHPPFAVVLPS